MCQRNFSTPLLEERKGPVTLKIIRFDGRFIQLTSVAKIKKIYTIQQSNTKDLLGVGTE